MPKDIHALQQWIRIVALIAAACTTAVPVIYAFFPWRSRLVGKLFMMESIAFALLMDISMLGIVWHPTNIVMIFWIDAVVLTLIAVSTAAQAVLMVKVKLSSKKGPP